MYFKTIPGAFLPLSPRSFSLSSRSLLTLCSYILLRLAANAVGEVPQEMWSYGTKKNLRD